jgi:hypothetical protein
MNTTLQGRSGLSCVSCVRPSVSPPSRSAHVSHGFAQPCGTQGVTVVTIRVARHTGFWLNHLTRPLSLLRREGVGPGRAGVRDLLSVARDAGGNDPISPLLTHKPHGYGRKQEFLPSTSPRSPCKRPFITRKRYELRGRSPRPSSEAGGFKFSESSACLSDHDNLGEEKRWP